VHTLRTVMASSLAAATLALAPLASASLVSAPLVQATLAVAAPMPANDATDCLDQGKIWLAIQNSKKELLVNKCVEKAATGSQVLIDAGVKTTKDAKGFICAMEGEPAVCPTKFDGNYWHYYQGTADAGWKMSEKGADQSAPAAGTLEGWCYGKECALPAVAQLPAATDAAAASASPEASSTSNDAKSTPWGLITTVAVVALAAVAALVLARRRKA